MWCDFRVYLFVCLIMGMGGGRGVCACVRVWRWGFAVIIMS